MKDFLLGPGSWFRRDCELRPGELGDAFAAWTLLGNAVLGVLALIVLILR